MKLPKLSADRVSLPRVLRWLFTGWLLAATLEYFRLHVRLRDLSTTVGLADMNRLRVVVITLAVAGLLWCVSLVKNTEKAEKWTLFASFTLLAAGSLWVNFSWGYLAACLLILLGILVYAFTGWQSRPECLCPAEKGHWGWKAATAVLAAAFFLFVSVWTVCRYRSFCTPSYDFGIFAQMFHNMKETGLPVTTLERDGALSHFQVHMSPIYYLMLPFYWIFPDPATLQVLQAAVLASAVIPLWLIGREHGLSAPMRAGLCAILLLYPALSGGTSYDIHENCFLTPLILWLFYGIDRKSPLLTGIFGALTLTVKEDAAVYVAVVALWMILRTLLHDKEEGRRQLVTGICMLAAALLWFFAVTGYLEKNGDGVMTYRYQNFMFDGSNSLISVVWAVIVCPMKAIYESVEPEKLAYIAQTMLPLLGLPLLTRRYERYLLLIPYLLVNLMSDYQYQHNIFFQYGFGSTACLLYLTAVNLADWKFDRLRLTALATAVAVSVAFFAGTVVPVAIQYPKYCVQYEAYYDQVRQTLDKIPEGASVSATTFHTAYLSDRAELYDIRYSSWEHIRQTDYVVLKVGVSDYAKFAEVGQDNGYERLTAMLVNAGFTLWETMGNSILIYKSSGA